ncbi:hypothetical protein Vau01_052920 [Virgisporangium aurantiacum]|uniref:Fibronectin type-III domain-containing protein n=1 Tax=Virgisporangium aurantiacum TaxID=175570 RepID=A0A8J4E1E3_9ACTN|nr:hypothetical protein Vau01_052920 [Virgisporangium aurantiacum]
MVSVDRGSRRFAWLPVVLTLALAVSLLPAVEMPQSSSPPGTPAGVAGAPPVLRDLPAGTRPNAAPRQRTPVVPPPVAAAAAPRALSAAEWSAIPAAASSGRVATTAEVVFENVELRPGYTLGDTSFVAYFDLRDDDRSFTSWTVRLFDAAAGTEQASTTLAPADLDPACETIRKYCKTFGAAQGWVLDPAREYFITITATFADGTEVESARSPNAKPRTTIVPPAVTNAQAAGCNCGNALGLTEAGQAVRGMGVNTANGAYVRLERDLSMASFGVEFTSVRTYSSAVATPGPFGTGWSWSYGMRVTTGDEGVTVRAQDGAEAFYRLNAAGGYDRPAGVRSNLRRAGAGWELVTVTQTVYAFDAEGRLTSILNPRGAGVRLAYTATGLTVTDASGRVATVTVTDALIRKVRLPDNRYVEYGYEQGRLASVRDVRGNTWRYRYNDVGLLTEVISPIKTGKPARNVVDVRNEYGADGRVVKQFDALGNLTTFEWHAAEEESFTTDPDGVVTVDGYRGNVLVHTQRGGRDAVNHRYDGRLNRNLVVNGKHNQHESTFDDNGNITEQKAPLPFTFNEVTKYDARNNPIEVKDARDNVWKNTFNEFNELVESVDAEGNRIRFEYDDRGLPTIRIDQRNKVTRYEYLPVGDRNNGLLKSVISPEARRTEVAYDATGRQVSVTDPRGTVPGADPAAYTTRYVVDAADQVTAVQQPGKRNPATTVFDEAGRMIKRVTPTGIETRFSYYDDGLLKSTTDPRRESVVTYTAAGRKASTRLELGAGPDIVTTFGYNAKGLLEKTTSPRGNVPGANPADFTTTYFYDGNDNLIRMRRPYPGSPGFVDKDFKADELDRTKATVDEFNRTSSFERDNGGNVTKTTDTLGRTTQLGYDRNGRQNSITDSGGKQTGFAYDAAGNKISRTMPEGGVITWDFDGDGKIVATTDPRGNVPGGIKDRYTTRYRYDRAGNLQEVVDPLGHSTVSTFDANNRVTAVSDAKGRSITYTYDEDDRPKTIHAPDAPVDPHDPAQYSTVVDYHPDGMLKSVRDPNGHVRRYDYDQAGRMVRQTDPLGRRTEISYDVESNVLTQITLGANENPGSSARAARTIVDTYDIVGRRTQRALGTTGPMYTWGYDAKDRTTFYGDPAGSRRVDYNDEDEITAVTRTETVGGRTEAFSYGYDERGNLKRRTNPDGTVIGATYDDDGRVTTVSASGGSAGLSTSTWNFGYDIAGRRTTTTLPAATGLVETRSYDDAGRLVGIGTRRTATQAATTEPATEPATEPTTTEPAATEPAATEPAGPAPSASGSGSPTPAPSTSDSASPAPAAPDAATTDRSPGAPTTVTAKAGAAQAAVTWKPPADAGSSPLTGFTVTASPGGRSVTVAPGTTTAVVDRLEPGTAYTFTVTASNKHGAGPASVPSLPVVPVPVPQDPVSGFQLTLDELGNPTRIVTTRNGVSESVAYAYDAVDRVTSACYGALTCTGAAAGRIDYKYDLVGNRTRQTLSGSAGSGVTDYDYDDADQLKRQATQVAGRTAAVDYEYDLDGNQTRAGGDTFAYNLDGTLAKATVSGRPTAFGYDASGLRLTGTTGTGDQAVTQRWSWDTNGTLPQIAVDTVTTASGQTAETRGFVYGPDDEPLALLDAPTGAHSYTHDWLGGISAMLSPAGVPEQAYDYDPFGNPRMGETLAGTQSNAGTQGDAGTQSVVGPTNPLRYAGAYQDNSTGNGNYYLRARNYNPATGRFTSTDPVARGGAAVSSYVYADNNPLAYADPTGLEPQAGDGGGQPVPPATGEQNTGPSPEDIARANQLQNKSLLDVVLEAGGQILMEILGINDIIDCLKGDIGACVMTVIGALPWGKIFKAKKIGEALWRAGKAIFKFFEEVKWAKAILKGAKEAAERAKAAAAAAAKAAADKAAAVKAAAERAAKKAAEEAAARAKAVAAKAKAKTKKGAGKSDDPPGAPDSCPARQPDTRNSFVAGTPVLLADGSTRPIERVEPGDTVVATDPLTGGAVARQVTHGIRTDSDKDFVDVTVGAGKEKNTVTATAHHPFWSVTQGRWVDAGDLRPGELLRTSAGTYVQVTAVHRYTAQRVTYDLTVASTHTYHVLAGTTPVLVHNTCPPVIALGLTQTDENPLELAEFAHDRGATPWTDWPDPGNPWPTINEALSPDSTVQIHFNLNGIRDPRAWAQSGSELTAMELAAIRDAPASVQARVTWWLNGRVDKSPFVD